MDVLITTSQVLFIIFMLGIMALFLFSLLFTWAWAQQSEPAPSFAEILAISGIEWGGMLTLLMVGHLLPPKIFFEAPPLDSPHVSSRQIPIVLVPSLHTGRGLFFLLCWRLRKNFCASLFPFSWKTFLHTKELLEDQLLGFIESVLAKTKSTEIRVISFGTSRPVVTRVLTHRRLDSVKAKWIAISSPKSLGLTLKFLTTKRLQQAYETQPEDIDIDPQLHIIGSHDVFCYPKELFGNGRSTVISMAGHYSILLQSQVVLKIMAEFGI